jgi:two-component system response regulator QseB
MRLLLAEDDSVLGRAICGFLMRDGHAVDWATDGTQLLALSAKYEYDCMLLDLGLPEQSGDDCLVKIRSRENATPVIVITARGFKDQRIRLLDIGADDYLVKPFDLTELGARIKAVVRRSSVQESGGEAALTYGPLTLQRSSSTVLWHGVPIALTGTEIRLLEALVQNRSRIVTRQHLEAEIYGWNEDVGSNAIEVHVHFLRRKISPDLIRTIRGVGYQIASY